MHSQQLVRHFPAPKALDAFDFLGKFENPFVADGDDDHSEIDRWHTYDWVMTANSRVVIRQPVPAIKELTAEQLRRTRGKKPFIKDEKAFGAWVYATFNNRKTTVSDWCDFSGVGFGNTAKQLGSTPPSKGEVTDMMNFYDYGMPFLLELIYLPGILIAEDKEAQILHFVFDGGQGFISKQSIWSKS